MSFALAFSRMWFVAEDAKGPEFLRILSLMDEARSRAARLHKKQQELLQKEALLSIANRWSTIVAACLVDV